MEASAQYAIFMQCPKHGVSVHQKGCVLCNGSWDGRVWRFPQEQK